MLGGGGARGSAHVGVLKVLERERIPVCKVAGTSMGSIVGGLYATGYTPAEMENLIDTIDWADMFVDDPPRPGQPMRRKDADFRYLLDLEIGYVDGRVVLPVGIVQGQKLLMLMRRLTISTWNVNDFDQLPILFRAVAADIINGDKVVFEDGDLALAIRSSMSVPGAFAPVRVGDRLLVDGGMVDNVPVDVVRQMGADRLIVVDVGSPLHKEEALTNPLVIMDQMISALMTEKTEATLATLRPEDVLIRPELGDITAAEFNRGAEAIAIGERAAEAALPRLRALSVDEATYAAYRERQRKRDFDPKLVAFLDVVEGRSPSATREVERAVAPNLDEPFDAERLEKTIGTAYGDGRFQQIDYRLVERNGERGLQIIPAEKPWSAFGKLGFQLDDNFNGRNSYMVSAELTFNDVNTLGAEWRNVLRLGRITGLLSEFYQPLGETGAFYVKPALELRNESFPLWIEDAQLAEYRVNRRRRRRSGLVTATGMAHQCAAGRRQGSRRPAHRQSGRLHQQRGEVRRRVLQRDLGHAGQHQLPHARHPRERGPGDLPRHRRRERRRRRRAPHRRLGAGVGPLPPAARRAPEQRAGRRQLLPDAGLPRRLPQSFRFRRTRAVRHADRTGTRGDVPPHGQHEPVVLDADVRRCEP